MGLLRGFIQNRNDTVTFWIAVASFILSVATFVLSNLINPDVEMEVARFVRVGHVQPNGSAYLTIQPTVVSFGRSTRVEVLRNFVVEVAPEEGQGSQGQPTEFTWENYGTFNFNAEEDPPFSYELVGDPAPLVVSPTEPLSPVLRLKAPEGWYFKEGTYEMTLLATPTVDGWPRKLREDFEVTFKQGDIEQFDELSGKRGTAVKLMNVEEPRRYRFVEWIS